MEQGRGLTRRTVLQLSGAAASLAALSACGATPTPQVAQETAVAQATVVVEEQATAPAAKQPVSFSWWDFPRSWAPPGSADMPNAWNEEMAKKYMEASSEVKIEFTGVGWGDGPDKLQVAMAAQSGPDIMYGYPALFGKMLSLDALDSLDDYLATLDAADVADFFEPAWAFVTVSGKKWGWPWYYGSEGEWCLSKTIATEVAALDLMPKEPDFGWTPDQFIEFAKKCTFERGADKVWGIYLFTNQS